MMLNYSKATEGNQIWRGSSIFTNIFVHKWQSTVLHKFSIAKIVQYITNLWGGWGCPCLPGSVGPAFTCTVVEGIPEFWGHRYRGNDQDITFSDISQKLNTCAWQCVPRVSFCPSSKLELESLGTRLTWKKQQESSVRKEQTNSRIWWQKRNLCTLHALSNKMLCQAQQYPQDKELSLHQNGIVIHWVIRSKVLTWQYSLYPGLVSVQYKKFS